MTAVFQGLFVAFFPQFVGIASDSHASLVILSASILASSHLLIHRQQRWIAVL
ncbi:hypothetical protein F4827_003224 [Paraburkholderia bannensis]|uniref:Uncharacterized protein n=1 Tax=Paraburkholderia bannensis TaxID=765414 RepID=A0A7W9TXW6_9BURK|nr:MULTISPECIES: hypothetical protein [Paraburkholderia]MBB3258356.1 hypothetical protein [Paraburkholderia sp. WP4_3_2]MBB6103369.1 hypothetical protein [Paraburkholderia bannensis]